MNFAPEEYERYRLADSDILLNEGQSRELVGRPAIFRGEVPGACFQNTLVRFRARRAVVLPEYALSVFRAYLHTGRFQAIAKWTTSIAHLGSDRFAALEFPLPPLAEQRRIVAKLEALLDRSRRAKEPLAEIRRLEEAALGYFVTDWPEELLGDHIRERVELAGQRWQSLPVVGLSNDGVIGPRREALGTKTAHKCKVVHPGDIVFNPIRFSIGSVARYYGSEAAIVSPEYSVVTVAPTLSAEVLRRFLRSPIGRSTLETETQGSVRYRVYFENLRQLRMPLAPREKQEEAEKFFSSLNRVLALVADTEVLLPRLESALLAKAFRGELVEQDPSDEPAAVMLERIRREREERRAETPGRPARRRAPTIS